jgi:hypothetical protein
MGFVKFDFKSVDVTELAAVISASLVFGMPEAAPKVFAVFLSEMFR